MSGRFPSSSHRPIDAEFRFWGQAQSRQDSESDSSWPGSRAFSFVRRQEVPSAKSTAPMPIWDPDEGASDPDTSAHCDVRIGREGPETSFSARPEIHRFEVSGASSKACRLGSTPAGCSQPIDGTDGGDFLVGEIVDHDADYRRGIRIRGIWPEDELNDPNRRILTRGGDGVNAKSQFLCEGKGRDAENEREQKEQSFHQVWFRRNSIEQRILRVRKMIRAVRLRTNSTSGGELDPKERTARVGVGGLPAESWY